MLRSLGLFNRLPCPQEGCIRSPCIFSHDPVAIRETKKRKNSDKDRAVSAKRQQAHESVPSTTVSTKPSITKPIPSNALSSTSIQSKSLPSRSTASTEESSKATPKTSNTTSNPTSAVYGQGPPRILPNLRSPVPLKVRQSMANKVYEQFVRIYQPLQNPSLATEHAEEQESRIFSQSENATTYKQLAVSVLMRLKKRPPAANDSDIGIDGKWQDPTIQPVKLDIANLAKPFILTAAQLETLEYPLPSILDSQVDLIEACDTIGSEKICDRCSNKFIVKDMLDSHNAIACSYHYRNSRLVKSYGEKERIFSCCGLPIDAEGCMRGPHVFKDETHVDLHAKFPFVATPASSLSSTKKRLVALDGEMCYTALGMELVRLTAVDEEGQTIIDELVLPSAMVIDLNTRFSGIKTLEGAKHDLASIRNEMFKYIDSETILLGHGLENDLCALRIIHPTIIDTCALFPHSKGLPFRNSLKLLSLNHLQKFIQTNESDGHDSLEDATTCLDLLKLYIEKNGPTPC